MAEKSTRGKTPQFAEAEIPRDSRGNPRLRARAAQRAMNQLEPAEPMVTRGRQTQDFLAARIAVVVKPAEN
jgi:hypothetical protein